MKALNVATGIIFFVQYHYSNILRNRFAKLLKSKLAASHDLMFTVSFVHFGFILAILFVCWPSSIAFLKLQFLERDNVSRSTHCLKISPDFCENFHNDCIQIWCKYIVLH